MCAVCLYVCGIWCVFFVYVCMCCICIVCFVVHDVVGGLWGCVCACVDVCVCNCLVWLIPARHWQITKSYVSKQWASLTSLFLALWHLCLSLFSSDRKGLCLIPVPNWLVGWEAEKVLPEAVRWVCEIHQGGEVVCSLWSEFWGLCCLEQREPSEESHRSTRCSRAFAVSREGISVTLPKIRRWGAWLLKKNRAAWVSRDIHSLRFQSEITSGCLSNCVFQVLFWFL